MEYWEGDKLRGQTKQSGGEESQYTGVGVGVEREWKGLLKSDEAELMATENGGVATISYILKLFTILANPFLPLPFFSFSGGACTTCV